MLKIFTSFLVNLRKFIFDNVIYYKYQSKCYNFYKKNSFRHNDTFKNKPNVVYLEYYPIWGSQISFLYLVKVLAEKYNANIIIYNPIPTKLLKKYYLILSLKLKINFLKYILYIQIKLLYQN